MNEIIFKGMDIQISVAHVFKRLMRKKYKRFTYLIAGVTLSFKITFMIESYKFFFENLR